MNQIKRDKQKVEALKREQQVLQEKMAGLDVALKEKNRKLDTRRKIVAGAAVLTHAERDEVFAEYLAGLFDKVLRERDRALFDLPNPEVDGAPVPSTENGVDVAAGAGAEAKKDTGRKVRRRLRKTFAIAGEEVGDNTMAPDADAADPAMILGGAQWCAGFGRDAPVGNERCEIR